MHSRACKTDRAMLSLTIEFVTGPALNFRNAVPLGENVAIEFDGTLELPEAAYTTHEDGRMCLGLGDFKVDLNEVNVMLHV